MARERLTSRSRRAADDKTAYPGSINQEGREEEGRGSMTYRTFEPSVENHEGVDYGQVNSNDANRNEIGMGIPDPASNTLITAADYQRKCLKAAQLAELYLGEKVSDRVLLAQARDFLAIDEDAIDRAIERFNRTESVYAAEEKDEKPAEEAPKAEEKPVVAAEEPKKDEKPAEEAPKAEEKPVVAAVESPVVPAAPAAPVVPAAPAPAEAPKAEEKPVEVKAASQERAINVARLAARTLPATECTRENIVKQCEKFASLSDEQLSLMLVACGEMPVVQNAPVAAPKAAEQEEVQVASSSAVDLGGFDLSAEYNDAALASDPNADMELASLFGDASADMVAGYQQPVAADPVLAAAEQLTGERAKTASAKVGVQSVGNAFAPAQPVVASAGDELNSLWKDSPDVTPFFNQGF